MDFKEDGLKIVATQNLQLVIKNPQLIAAIEEIIRDMIY
jgi:hypothetical protein